MQEAIKVERLSKSYGNLVALDSLNLCVRKKHRFWVTGRKWRGEKYNHRMYLGDEKS